MVNEAEINLLNYCRLMNDGNYLGAGRELEMMLIKEASTISKMPEKWASRQGLAEAASQAYVVYRSRVDDNRDYPLEGVIFRMVERNPVIELKANGYSRIYDIMAICLQDVIKT